MMIEGVHDGISIHAPVKGATLRIGAYGYARPEFQSTLPYRERLDIYDEQPIRDALFQSTLP